MQDVYFLEWRTIFKFSTSRATYGYRGGDPEADDQDIQRSVAVQRVQLRQPKDPRHRARRGHARQPSRLPVLLLSASLSQP